MSTSTSASTHSTIGPLPPRNRIRNRNSTAPKPGAPRPFERDSVGLPLALDIQLASDPATNQISAASTQSFPSSIYPDPESAFALSPAAKELDSAKVGYGFEHGGAGFGGEMDEYDEDMPMPEVYMDEKERMPPPRASLDSGILSPGQLSKLRIATPKMAMKAEPVDVHGRPLPVPAQTAVLGVVSPVVKETVCEVHASTEDCTDECRANQAARPRPLPAQPQPSHQSAPPAHQPAPPQWEGDYEFAISPDTPSPAPGTGKKRGFLPLGPSPPHSRESSPEREEEVKVPELWSPRAEREDGIDREERMRMLRKEAEEESAREEKLAQWGKKSQEEKTTRSRPLSQVLIPASTLDLGPSLDLSWTPPSPSPAATPTPTPIEQIQARVFAVEKRPPVVIRKKYRPLNIDAPRREKGPTPLASSIPPPPHEAPPAPPESSPLKLSASGSLPAKASGSGSAAASRAGMERAFEDAARRGEVELLKKKKSGSAAASAAGMAAAFEATEKRAESPVASSSKPRSGSPAASAAGMAAAFEAVALGSRAEAPKKRSGSPAASAAGMADAFEAAATSHELENNEVSMKRYGSPAISAAAQAAAFETAALHATSTKKRSYSPAASAAGMAAAFDAAASQHVEDIPKKGPGSPAASAAGMAAAFEAAAQPTPRSHSSAASAASMAVAFEKTAQRCNSPVASSSKSQSHSPAASSAGMAAAFETTALISSAKKSSASPAASAAGMADAFEAAAHRAESSKIRLGSPAASAAGMAAAFEAVAQGVESPVTSSSKARSGSPAASAAGMAAAFEAVAQPVEGPVVPSKSKARSGSPAASAAGMATAFEATAEVDIPKKRSGSPAASAAGIAAAFDAAAQRAETPVASASKSRSISPALSAVGMAAAFEATASPPRSRSHSPAVSAAGMAAAFESAAQHNDRPIASSTKSRSVSPASSAAGMATAFDAAARRNESLISNSRSVSPAAYSAGMASAFEVTALRVETQKKHSGSAATSAAGMAAAFEAASKSAMTEPAMLARSTILAAHSASEMEAALEAVAVAEEKKKSLGSAAASAAGMAAAFEAASQRSVRSGSPAAAAAGMAAAFEAAAQHAQSSSRSRSASPAASAASMAAAFEAAAVNAVPTKKPSHSAAASAAGMAAAFEAAASTNNTRVAIQKKSSGSAAASAAGMAAAFEMAAHEALPQVMESVPMKVLHSAAASAAGMVAAFEAAAALNEDAPSMEEQTPTTLNIAMRPMSIVSATTFATSVASSARSSMTESETESMMSSGTVRPPQPTGAGLPLDVAEDMGVRTGSSSTTPVHEAPIRASVDEDDVPLSQLRNDSRRETSMSPPRRTSSLQARVGLPATPRPQSAASIPRPESSASLPRPLPAPPGHARSSSTQSIRDATMSSHPMRSSSRPGSADRARASLSQQSSRSSLHPGSRASAMRSGRSSPSQMPPRMSPPQGPLPSLPPTGAEGTGTTMGAQGSVPPTYAFHDNSNTVFEAPLAMPHALPARAPMAEREPEASSTDSPQSQTSVLTEFENTLAILDSEGEREPLPAYMLRAGTGEATLARGPRRAYRAAIPPVGGIIDINLSHLPADVRAALSGSEPSITSGAAPQQQSNPPDSDTNAPNWPPRGVRLEPLDSGDVTPPTYMRVEGAGERKRAKDRFKALFSRKRAMSMSEAPVPVPLERAASVMTSETSMSNSNGGGSLLRRIRSRRNDSSVSVNHMPEADGSMPSLAEAHTNDGAAPAMEGFEGLPSTEPAEGRPLLRDGQILVYPEGEVCPHCGNTGYLPHNHSHDGPHLACPACWPKFARPFGAKLARFFRSGSLKGPDGERVRRRLQRPLSAPAGLDHAPAASMSGNVSRRGEDTRWVADTVTADWPGQREARAVQALRV